jgi:hypothetical protein
MDAAPFQHKTIRRRPQFPAAPLFVLKQRGRRRISVGRVRCCPEFAAAVREKKRPRKLPFRNAAPTLSRSAAPSPWRSAAPSPWRSAAPLASRAPRRR